MSLFGLIGVLTLAGLGAFGVLCLAVAVVRRELHLVREERARGERLWRRGGPS